MEKQIDRPHLRKSHTGAVRLHPDQWDGLKQIAHRFGISRSQAFRWAVREFLEAHLDTLPRSTDQRGVWFSFKKSLISSDKSVE
jgi:hypothetical protein